MKQADSSEYLQVARSTARSLALRGCASLEVKKLDVASAFEEAVCVEGKHLEA